MTAAAWGHLAHVVIAVISLTGSFSDVLDHNISKLALKGRNHGCLEALLAGYHRHQSPVQLDTRNLLDGRLGSYTRTRNVPWTGNVPPRS